MSLKIGELAKVTGASPPTIRYYEDVGLLPRPRRSSNGQRSYDEEAVSRLRVIRQCRQFGFPLRETRALLALLHDHTRTCSDARDVAQGHLDAVRTRLKELKALERSLTGFVAECDTVCGGGPIAACRVFNDIAAGRAPAHKAGTRTPPLEVPARRSKR